MEMIDGRSVDTLHQAFLTARSAFEVALQSADGHWEEPLLEPEDGGETAWPAHMAAAHALLGERWRFRYIALLLDQPLGATPVLHEAFAESEPGRDELAQRQERYEALSSATATIEAAAAEWPEIDAVYARLDDEDLTRAAGLSTGQLGYLESMGQPPSNDLRGCLLLAVVHVQDHAQQIRAAFAS